MALHLAEISRTVAPGAHAVLLLDQAGWHLSDKLDIPANITLVPLPPKSPELNPVENIWQFMRDNWLSNRVFRSYDDIIENCCYAWNICSRPIKQPADARACARELIIVEFRGFSARSAPSGDVTRMFAFVSAA